MGESLPPRSKCYDNRDASENRVRKETTRAHVCWRNPMRKLRRLPSATAVVVLACSFWSPTHRRSDVHAANLDFESGVAARMAAAMTTHAQQLAARGESLAAVDERCIHTPPQRGCR